MGSAIQMLALFDEEIQWGQNLKNTLNLHGYPVFLRPFEMLEPSDRPDKQ